PPPRCVGAGDDRLRGRRRPRGRPGRAGRGRRELRRRAGARLGAQRLPGQDRAGAAAGSPLAASRRARGVAHERIRRALAGGSDTLAFFKLRRDTHYLFSADRRAFFAYRVEAGTMLISGDPVGPEDALPELVREGCEYAERCGLKVGVVGASNRILPLFADAGLRAMYVGDEAIVETAGFWLEGRAI